ncbi:hypothetical protein EJ04DRAFT_512920 [Polyplosphaeria fusca]|uniref:DUF952 domain-containing protein n=1 Tax=Polyplosphaeria fusca TaxID=682080 RepID=A0A9P4QWJ6_9PLEO|nr:hypothetical protein EJ04DRAFT_512920 [Polyplosphaeria fusca]
MAAPYPLPTYLFKILPSAPPSPLPERLPLSDLDRNDGYIHLSTSEQTPSTLDKFFADATEIWLLRIKYEVLAKGIDGDGSEGKGEVKWEAAGRGVFAHLYGGDLGKGNVDCILRVEKKGTWAESMEFNVGVVE